MTKAAGVVGNPARLWQWLVGHKERIGLASMAYVQVVMVAMNTVYISTSSLQLAFMTSLGINYVWTRNVKRAAFGSELDRWFYCIGGALGCITGTVVAHAIMGNN